jgi:hypothetical protein
VEWYKRKETRHDIITIYVDKREHTRLAAINAAASLAYEHTKGKGHDLVRQLSDLIMALTDHVRCEPIPTVAG